MRDVADDTKQQARVVVKEDHQLAYSSQHSDL
jgi:hypothetical protein